MSVQGSPAVSRSVGFSIRLCAAGIDLAIIAPLLFVSFAFVAQLAILGKTNLLLDLLAFTLGVFSLFLPAIYFWIFTWKTGQTPGKRLLGLTVVDELGRRPQIGQTFLREVCAKFVLNIAGPTIPVWYFGFLSIIWDKNHRGWHDKLAGTYVVSIQFPFPLHPTRPVISDRREWLSRGFMAISFLSLAWFFISLAFDSLPPRPMPADATSKQPLSISEPLNPTFLRADSSITQHSKSEWSRLLAVNNGRARVVPLERIDPSKEPVFFIPGIGVNFQDVHGLAQLGDQYQVVIGIYDRSNPLDRNAQQLSQAIVDFSLYRQGLSAYAKDSLQSELKLIGHSLGGLLGTLVLAELEERGVVGLTPDNLFSRVIFINIDAPWRGFDVPWVFTLPGVKHVAREILPRVPLPTPATRSALSVVNRTSSMDSVLGARFSASTEVQLVSVLPYPYIERSDRVQPVSGWHSSELGPGELQSLWLFFSSTTMDTNTLDRWDWGPFVRGQNLQQLMLTLQRDIDYQEYSIELKRAASMSTTLSQFQPQYDSLVGKIVDTFHGQHTKFMWENDRFLPWVRDILDS